MNSMSSGVVSDPGLSGVAPEAMLVRPRSLAICPAMLLSSFTEMVSAVTNRMATDSGFFGALARISL